MTARLTVVSGPTAVGKGTVVAHLAKQHPEIFVSVSVTTRPPRPGEIDGVHYHFVSAAVTLQRISIKPADKSRAKHCDSFHTFCFIFGLFLFLFFYYDFLV